MKRYTSLASAGEALATYYGSVTLRIAMLTLAALFALYRAGKDDFSCFKISIQIHLCRIIIFGSIQSVANAGPEFFLETFSLLIIDECHRVSIEGDTQYLQVITKLKVSNPQLCILGLTATPYRLGLGWIYEYHCEKKIIRSKEGVIRGVDLNSKAIVITKTESRQ